MDFLVGPHLPFYQLILVFLWSMCSHNLPGKNTPKFLWGKVLKWRHQNGRHSFTTFPHISVSLTRTILILVAKPMFLWSRNSIMVPRTSFHLDVAAILKLKWLPLIYYFWLYTYNVVQYIIGDHREALKWYWESLVFTVLYTAFWCIFVNHSEETWYAEWRCLWMRDFTAFWLLTKLAYRSTQILSHVFMCT